MKSKKMMFKCFLLLMFCLHAVFAVAQRPSVELTVTQPSPNLNIRLLYDKYNLIAGQEYTIIVENLSNKNMHVKGQLVAVLVCGNEVSTKFDEVLKPSEKMGGHAYLFDASGMTGIVRTEDCQNFETVLNDKGDKEHNRIRTLQLRSYSSVIEKTDEEKAEEQRQRQLTVERKQQEEDSKQAAANQQIKMQHDAQIQQQNAYNQRQQQLQAQMQAIQKQQQQNQQTITDVGNTIKEGIEGIAAIYERKLQREQAEQEQQRLKVEMERLQKVQEDEDRKQKEDAAAKVEQKRIAGENSNINMWQNKSLIESPASAQIIKPIIVKTLSEAKIKDNPDVLGGVIGYIPANTSIEIVGKEKEYWKVFYKGQVGYSHEMYFEKSYETFIIQEAEKYSKMPPEYQKNNEIATITNPAKMRVQPSPNSDIIAYISKGSIIYIIGFVDGYWKIFYDSREGYLIDGLYFEVTYNMMRFKKK